MLMLVLTQRALVTFGGSVTAGVIMFGGCIDKHHQHTCYATFW